MRGDVGGVDPLVPQQQVQEAVAQRDVERLGEELVELRLEPRGPRRVAVHKGIAGPIPGSEPAAASPRELKGAPMADLYEKGISLGVMSKAYGLAGLRIGWVASHFLS